VRGGSGGLPEGWVCTALEDVCEINPPRLPDDATEADLVSFVPMAAVEEENGGIDVAAARRLKEVRKGYTQFRSGDVLLAKITPCMENGKLAVVPAMPSSFGYGSTEFFVLRPRRPEFALWIARYLSRRSFRDAARHHMQGAAGQLRVPKKWLQTVEIPVAPLPEQHRIVTKLDELFSELDAGVAALERAQVKLERYRASVLKAAVDGRLTERWRQQNPPTETGVELLERILAERRRRWEEEQLASFEAKGKKPPKDWKRKYKEPVAPDTAGLPEVPEGWCWATVGVLTHTIKDGPHYSPQYSEEGIPFISGGNVRPEGVDFSTCKYVSTGVHAELSKRCQPQVGDVLYTKGGTTGIARVNTYPIEFNVWVHVAVLRPVKGIEPFYLQHALNSPWCYRQAQGYTHGVGNQDLGLTRMARITVPVPPPAEQLAIIQRISALDAVALAAAETSGNAMGRATHLRQSILTHAFEGRLVAHDPDDEPASVLLGRIRAEREEASSAPARGPGARRRSAARPRPKN